MSGLKLYELGHELARVYGLLEASEGELTPEIEAALNDASGAFDDKCERVALYVRSLAAEAAGIEVEAQRLAKRQKARERAAVSLRAYLHAEMERAGKDVVKGVLATVRLQASPPSVTLSDGVRACAALAELEPEWFRFSRFIPASQQINSKALIEAWKAGEPLPAGATVTQSSHLRIT